MRLFEERPHFYEDDFYRDLSNVSRYLGSRSAMLSGKKWTVKQPDGRWWELTDTAAAQSLRVNWSGNTGNPAIGVITNDDIKKFMATQAPVLTGMMKVPTSTAPALKTDWGNFANSWIDNLLAPDPNATIDPILRGKVHLLIRMIFESLCDHEVGKSLDEMMTIAESDDPKYLEFRFVMSWLAAMLQEPGRNLQTNLWFVGELGGSGKGTLWSVMSRIIGAGNHGLLNIYDIIHGAWSKELDGKLLIGVNEIKSERSCNINMFLKQNTTEETVQIRVKHRDSYTVINFANWIIMCNLEELPNNIMDAFDRRHFIVATTSSLEKTKVAMEFNMWMHDNPDEADRVLAGFVYILRSHKVQEKLIERAPDTQIKRDIQAATAPETAGLYWLNNDPLYPRDQFLPARDYINHYKKFHDSPRDVTLDHREFGQKLSKLARKGYILRENNGHKAARYKVSSQQFPADGSEGEAERQANAEASGANTKTRSGTNPPLIFQKRIK